MRKKLFCITIAMFCLAITSPAPAQEWSPPVRISEPGDCWDPQILAIGDTLHVVYENTGAGYDKIGYVRSIDGGHTWSVPVQLTERRGATVFPRIMGNGSQLMVVWEQVFNSGYDRYNVGYAISGDGGASWDSAEYIFDQNWVGMQNMAAAGIGSYVEVIVGTQVGYDFIFYDQYSTDFGASWSDTEEIFACYQSGRPDLAMSDSVIHFVWDGRFEAGPPWDIYYLRSLNRGLAWSESLLLSAFDEHGSEIPAICLYGPRRVAIAWMDGKYSPYITTGDILVRVSQDTGSTWGPEEQATFSHYAWDSDISANGDTIDIVWRDEALGIVHGSIYHTLSIDNGLSWSEPVRVDVADYDSRDPVITNSGGRKYVAWAESLYPPVERGLFISHWRYEADAAEDSRELDLPNCIELSAYPNPFNSIVTFSLYSEKGGEIRICDISGKLIRKFTIGSGANRVIWNAKGLNGEGLSSGIFFVEFQSGGHSRSMKLMYVK